MDIFSLNVYIYAAFKTTKKQQLRTQAHIPSVSAWAHFFSKHIA